MSRGDHNEEDFLPHVSEIRPTRNSNSGRRGVVGSYRPTGLATLGSSRQSYGKVGQPSTKAERKRQATYRSGLVNITENRAERIENWNQENLILNRELELIKFDFVSISYPN